jgi:hypothetical protein
MNSVESLVAKEQQRKDDRYLAASIAAYIALIGGSLAAYVKLEQYQAAEHPPIDTAKPATIASHRHIGSHVKMSGHPLAFEIKRVPESFVLHLEQNQHIQEDGMIKEVEARETVHVPEKVYDDYPVGSEIVISKVLAKENKG